MKIIPIFFYHEKWAVIMRKFVYSPDGGREDGSPSWGRKIHRMTQRYLIYKVEKMGPLRGDGRKSEPSINSPFSGREDGSPSWGRKPLFVCIRRLSLGREDGSPSWGRKQSNCIHIFHLFTVEKMGPLRGDGSHLQLHICHIQY